MAFCTQCGSQYDDRMTICPQCGAPNQMYNQPAANPYQQPYQAPYQQPAPNIPVQQPVVTTAGGWFGWIVLCSFLPLIGLIIMLCTSKDPSAKNYAKCMLIVTAIVVVFFAIFSAILVPAMLGYISKMA